MGTKARLRCLMCGEEFKPTCHITRQKFCSDGCRLAYNNAKRYFGGVVDRCPECGESVEQTKGAGRFRRFCSDPCRISYHRKQVQERRNQRERPKQICPNCGIEFQCGFEDGRARRFCSDTCRVEWWKEYHKAHQTKSPDERTCVCCGVLFQSDKLTGGVYCSRDCYLKTMAQTQEQVICGWCGDAFTAKISQNRKYCSKGCSVAARNSPKVYTKAMRRISYRNADQWREKVRQATLRAPKNYKRGKRVWLVCGCTSMYTGIDGMLAIIRYKLRHNPFDGAVYAFCDFSGSMLKYIEWDGSSFCISKRRAQSGTYPWPPSEAGDMLEINEKEWEFLKGKSIVPTRLKRVKNMLESAEKP